MRRFRWVFFPPRFERDLMIRKITNWSRIVRKDGLLALQKLAEKEPDKFVRKGLQLLVDGREPEEIARIMEIEIDNNANNEVNAAKVYEAMATIYGVGLANFFFLPMSHKLKTISDDLVQYQEMLMEGMVSIAEGENPRAIASKLEGYLA